MIDLPKEFTAKDPVTNEQFKLTWHGPEHYLVNNEFRDEEIPKLARALIQHGRELERKRINQEESCPDCGESFAEYVLTEKGWGNKPIPEERGKELLEKYRSKNEESEK